MIVKWLNILVRTVVGEQEMRNLDAQGTAEIEITKLRKAIKRHADRVERKVLVASESGLFVFGKRIKHEPSTTARTAQDAIVELLVRARKAARFGSDEEIYSAEGYLSSAQMLLDEAIAARGPLWKYVHLHRIGIFLYQITILGIIVGSALHVRVEVPAGFPIPFRVILKTNPSISGALSAAGFGAIGAVLRSLYYLFSKIGRSEFYDRFMIAHISAPWIGAILGVLIYLVISGGITTMTGPDTDSAENAALLYALALAAGFSWEDALRTLAGLAQRLNREEEGSEPNQEEETEENLTAQGKSKTAARGGPAG